MRLATFDAGRGPRVAIIAADDTLVPINDAIPEAPLDMLGVISAGDALHARLRDLAARSSNGARLATVRLLAPIPRPARNVFCVGWNYSEHFQEDARLRADATAPGQQEIPGNPTPFSTNPPTVTRPYRTGRYP